MIDVLLRARQTAWESHQVFKQAFGFDIMGRSQISKLFSKFKHWQLNLPLSVLVTYVT